MYGTDFLSWPSIVSPVAVTDSTFVALTWSRKKVYATVVRGSGDSITDAKIQFAASRRIHSHHSPNQLPPPVVPVRPDRPASVTVGSLDPPGLFRLLRPAAADPVPEPGRRAAPGLVLARLGVSGLHRLSLPTAVDSGPHAHGIAPG